MTFAHDNGQTDHSVTQPHPLRAALETEMAAEVAAVEVQLGRIDTKAGLLLGLTGAAATAAPLYVTGAGLPLAAAVFAWLGVAAFVASAASLALAIRPVLNMKSREPHGLVLYARASVTQIIADVARANSLEALAGKLAGLSTAANSKYRKIRTAVDLALVGLGLTVLTAITGFLFR